MAADTTAGTDTAAASGAATGAAAADTQTGAHGVDSATVRVLDHADIGIDEAHSAAVHDQTRSWNANTKRTHDVHQTLDSDGLHAARKREEMMFNLEMQVMQNAIETANMLSKQAVAHRDIAIDREWNIDEVASLVAKVLQTMQPTTAKT